jgi:hypothetical protein
METITSYKYSGYEYFTRKKLLELEELIEANPYPGCDLKLKQIRKSMYVKALGK